MGTSFDGFREFCQDLNAAAERLSASEGASVVRSIVADAAEIIYTQAKTNAETLIHQDSGILAASVKQYDVVHHRKGKGFSCKVGVSKKEKGAYYAAPVEYGHGGPHGPAAAHPFIRPAYDEKKDEAYERMRTDIINELKFRGL